MVRVTASNQAGGITTVTSSGCSLDNVPPTVSTVVVGTLDADVAEDVFDGVVTWVDTEPLPVNWASRDDESGVAGYTVDAMLVQDDGTLIKIWTKSVNVTRIEFVAQASTYVTAALTRGFTYRVCVTAHDQALLSSAPLCSTPIFIVQGDQAGVVLDGSSGIDIDYQLNAAQVRESDPPPLASPPRGLTRTTRCVCVTNV